MTEIIVFIVCVALFLVSALLTLIFGNSGNDEASNFCFGITVASAVILIFLVFSAAIEHSKPNAYPKSDYVLKYKVTEFDGHVDTTYVLTHKKK